MDNQVAERIRKEVSQSELNVSRVYKSEYQKEDTETAELRQTVTTNSYYPSKSVSNDMQDNIFGTQDFGFEEQKYTNTENRVAWIDVPQGMTVENVQAKLATYKDANLYRVLSNHPILTDNQVYAINEGLTTKDVFAERQIVRYPEGSTDGGGNSNAGEIALDVNGKPQYRSIFFSNTGKADDDRRTEDANDYYASESIALELKAEGQEQSESGQKL